MPLTRNMSNGRTGMLFHSGFERRMRLKSESGLLGVEDSGGRSTVTMGCAEGT